MQEKITIGSEVGVKINCAMCQKEGTTDQFVTLQGDKGQSIYLCPGCKQKANEAFEDETKNPNILLAIVVGAIAAAIGGIVWYIFAIITGIEFGYISLGLGYMVGFGVYLGAGKKRGHQLQIISALLAIVAIIVIEKFIFDHVLNEYIQNNPAEFPAFPTGESISISFFEPEFWKSFISPIGLLIYAIGIYLAYKFPKLRKI
jgi:hypothetical protein